MHLVGCMISHDHTASARFAITSCMNPSVEGATIPAAAEPLLHISLLGHMHVQDAAGRSVLPRARKTRAVLAILALAGSKPLPRSHLATLLWSRRGKEQAQASLRQCIHELQETFGRSAAGLLDADRHHLT